ncbi:hypothetical protein O1M54_03195 [Streptomyces diastatochromogenes]|nr:hypothetical protein [Streptomyces diastatochromogenes]
MRASARFRTALGELAEACARYAPFVSRRLPPVPDHHRDHVCTDTELKLLYLREDEQHWRPATHPWDVPVVARAAGLDAGEAQRRMAEFCLAGPSRARRRAGRPLGCRAGRRDRPPAPLRGPRRRRPHGAAVGRRRTGRAARDLGREAERVLAREAEALGLVHRRRYTRRSAGRDVLPSPETGSLVRWLHDADVRLEDGVSLRDLAFVRPHTMTWDEMSCFADELREAGVALPDAARLFRAWDDLPTPSRYAFSGEDPSWDGADYPVPASSAVLFTASQRLRQELSFMWHTAHEEARRLGLGADLVAPHLPEGLSALRPTWGETAALTDQGMDDETGEWFETPRWAPLTAQRLVDYACSAGVGSREAYRRLAPVRAIGALVPDLSGDAVAALPDDVPDAHDAVAVDPAFRVSEPGSPLVPLDLVSLAGRLGESVRHTWQRRIVPYLALEAAPPSIADVPDVVPGWRDLAILSDGLDGRLPALTGSVGRERVERCARAVDASPEWVRERLGVYAGMFGLRLESVGEPGAEPGEREERR